MGLDAHVRCNCIKNGLASAHPFPALLAYDENDEPYLKQEGTLEQSIQHDRWLKSSCPHGCVLVHKRIGNIAMAAFLRERLGDIGETRFPVLLQRVLYNGTHCGDAIGARRVPDLAAELRILAGMHLPNELGDFLSTMKELCDASLATGNPIVF
jgi:hypothetical protein